MKFVNDRNTVKAAILKTFAGPAETGVFSPSVQNTLHLTERLVLDSVPQVGQSRSITQGHLIHSCSVSDQLHRHRTAQQPLRQY